MTPADRPRLILQGLDRSSFACGGLRGSRLALEMIKLEARDLFVKSPGWGWGGSRREKGVGEEEEEEERGKENIIRNMKLEGSRNRN